MIIIVIRNLKVKFAVCYQVLSLRRVKFDKLQVLILIIMKMKFVVSTFFFFPVFTSTLYSQTVYKPNSGLRSHETLEISKIDITTEKTVIYLYLENEITGGYFCADKNVFILFPDGTRDNMISSKGIPVCPEIYKFKTIGEKLEFELTFPPLKKNTEWIDLIEGCSDNCFSFYGICLNSELNKKIEDASHLAEIGEPVKASLDFIKIANSIDGRYSGIAGLLYMNIIQLSKETGNTEKAAEWYQKLKSSDIPRKDLYLKHLDSQGIIY
jgi:hypothetical protein